MNIDRLEQTIYDIMTLLEKNGQEPVPDVYKVLAGIKEFCTDQGIVCNDCPFYVSEKIGCCFAPSTEETSCPELWRFKE